MVQIKPYYSAILHDKDCVELRFGVWNHTSHVLEDHKKEGHLANIVYGLTNKMSTAEITKLYKVTASQVNAVIEHLCHLGVVQDGAGSLIDTYLEQIGPVIQARQENPEHHQIIFLNQNDITQNMIQTLEHFSLPYHIDHESYRQLNEMSLEALTDAWQREHILENFESWQGGFLILAESTVHPIRARKLNLIAHALQLPWIHLAVDGPFLVIGPTFMGGRGPCYECFETRIDMNLRDNTSYQKYKNALIRHNVLQPHDALSEVCIKLLAAHGIYEMINYFKTSRNFTKNKVLTIFLPTMEFIYHNVLRLAACTTCGSHHYKDETQNYFDFQRLLEEHVV